MGRKKIEEKIGLDRILKAFEVHKSAHQTGLALGIHHATVARVIRDHGLELNYKKGHFLPGVRSVDKSQVRKWLQEERKRSGNRLPSEVDWLHKVSGFDKATIRSFIYKETKKLSDRLNNIPLNWEFVDTTLLDENGEFVQPTHIKQHRYVIDVINNEVVLEVLLTDNHMARLPIPDVDAWEHYFTELDKDVQTLLKSKRAGLTGGEDVDEESLSPPDPIPEGGVDKKDES